MMAAFVTLRVRQAERRNPPHGRFIAIDGVRLHYVEHGQGRPVVLVHGLGALIQDFELSGLVDLLASRYRVVIFDRPGAGYSERPRGRSWSIEDQADMLEKACDRLGLERPIVLGHSLGALVAVAMALQKPARIGGLVLVAGYFFRTPKISLVPFMTPGIPVVGDVLRYTVWPLLSWLAAPALFNRAFAPQRVPKRIRFFPLDLALRPSQLRANGQDAAALVGAAGRLSKRYGELALPTMIVAGNGDRLVSTQAHSAKLHQALPHSELFMAGDAGHMVHYVSPRHIAWAVDRAAHQPVLTIAGMEEAARGVAAEW
jgi:pimeloyl-ACP methyl ester carboxylesterase